MFKICQLPSYRVEISYCQDNNSKHLEHPKDCSEGLYVFLIFIIILKSITVVPILKMRRLRHGDFE